MMNTIYIFIFIVAAGLLFSGCTKDTGNNEALTIEDLLVKNNEITGWTYSGSGWLQIMVRNLHNILTVVPNYT